MAEVQVVKIGGLIHGKSKDIARFDSFLATARTINFNEAVLVDLEESNLATKIAQLIQRRNMAASFKCITRSKKCYIVRGVSRKRAKVEDVSISEGSR
jgi:ribosome-interacting GTPase 1